MTLGRHEMNIANMSLNRQECSTTAFTVLNLDTSVSDEVLRELGYSPPSSPPAKSDGLTWEGRSQA